MKQWIPRSLRNDGMIGGRDIPSYASDVTPYVLLSDHQHALAEKDQAYHALMGQAIKMAECAELLSDASLRVGEFDTESDGWPIYHHTGGLRNECSGVIADISYKRLADAFVKYHEHAVAFLTSPEVRAWREQEGKS